MKTALPSPPSLPWLPRLILGLPGIVCLAFSTSHLTTFSVLKEALTWLGVLACVALWRPSKQVAKPVWGAVAAYLMWCGVSSLWSAHPTQGHRALHMWLLLALWVLLLTEFFGSFSAGEHRHQTLQRIFGCWMVGILACALIALGQRLGWFHLGLHSVTGTIGNPNRLAGVLLLALPSALWCIKEPAQPWLHRLGIAALPLLVAGLWATRCTSAWISAAIVLSLWGILQLLHLYKAVGRPLVVSMLLLFTGVSGGTIWYASGWLWHSLEGRIWIAKISWGVWQQSPWVGVGPGAYQPHAAWVQASLLAETPRSWTNLMDPHHQLFDILCASGIVGLLLFALVCVLWLRGVIARWEQPHVQASLCALLGGAVYGLSETPMLSVTFVLLFGGWMALSQVPSLVKDPTLAQGDKAAPPPTKSGQDAWWQGFLWLLALVIAAWGTFGAVRALSADRSFGRGLRAAAKATPAGFTQAVKAYSQALPGSHSSADVLMSRGLAWRELGHLDSAKQDFQRSFALRPTPERALALAHILYLQKRSADAIHWGQKAIALHPRYARGYHNIGVFHMAQGKLDAAQRFLRRARSLRPSDPKIRRSWRQLLRKQRQLGRKRRLLRRKRRRKP